MLKSGARSSGRKQPKQKLGKQPSEAARWNTKAIPRAKAGFTGQGKLKAGPGTKGQQDYGTTGQQDNQARGQAGYGAPKPPEVSGMNVRGVCKGNGENPVSFIPLTFIPLTAACFGCGFTVLR
jgi:hypothetical protein